MADPLHNSLTRRDVEVATRAYGYFAYVGARLPSCRNHRTHQVTRLNPPDALVLLGTRARKAVLVRATHLPAAMTCCADPHRHDATHVKLLWGTAAHARRITPMLLGQSSSRPVILCQPSTATLHRQTQGGESFIQGPACRIDGGNIPVRRFDLAEYTR